MNENQIPKPNQTPNRVNPGKTNYTRLIINLSLILLVILAFIWFALSNYNPEAISQEQFKTHLYNNNVTAVEFVGSSDGGSLRVILKDSERNFKVKNNKIEDKNYDVYVTYVGQSSQDELKAIITAWNLDPESLTTDADFAIDDFTPVAVLESFPETNWFLYFLPTIISIGVLVIGVFILIRVMSKQQNGVMQFGKSRFKVGNNSQKTFADVAGIDEEKTEMQEIVDFLKNPDKFKKLGARIPKGFLLVGPPGTGKTLLAKAIAGESNCPFLTITGSDFVEMFVGVGASRVRDLFNQAKKVAPCLIFIDEIDAVGRKRGSGLGGGHDEKEQTLNQLLVEMDGFETNSGIIVIAATNRADVLDPALLRAGRFDRQIFVFPPDVKGREDILKIHAKGKPFADGINFKTIARLTTGFTGADLETLLNESAILAARENQSAVHMKDILEAINKVSIGPQKKSHIVTERDKNITAYHEAGHAIVQKALGEQVQEVSIIPRGMAGGYTISREDNDNRYVTQSKLLNNLTFTMGGRAAEILTIKDFTTGASGDIKQATEIARKMVTEWGMSKLGVIYLGGDSEVFIGKDFGMKSLSSEKTSADVDTQVSFLVNSALEKALEILKNHKKELEVMAKLLLERETILTEEVDMIMQGKTLEEINKKMKINEIKFKEEELKAAEAHLEKQKHENTLNAIQFLQNAGIIEVVNNPQAIVNNETETIASEMKSSNGKETAVETVKKEPAKKPAVKKPAVSKTTAAKKTTVKTVNKDKENK